MSPKAEHIPLLVMLGQRVQIIGHENAFWKDLDGQFGAIIGKAGPDIAAGREQVLYHIRLLTPLSGFPPDIWVSRCDFRRA